MFVWRLLICTLFAAQTTLDQTILRHVESCSGGSSHPKAGLTISLGSIPRLTKHQNVDIQSTTARKRGTGPPQTADGSSNDTGVAVDVGGLDTGEENVSSVNDKHDDEREELLALYFRRRAKDIKEMIADGRFYAIIDTLRPYFDVDTSDVVRKLIYSLLPNVPTSNEAGRRAIHKRYTSKPDLYGPFVLTLTMAAVLTLSVELKDDWPRHYAEQTILGTSVFLAFACWLGFTCLVKIGFYALGEMMSWVNCAYVVGYALSGHCIALAANLIFSYMFFLAGLYSLVSRASAWDSS